MTKEDFNAVLEVIGGDVDGDWHRFPEGLTATFQIAKDGVGFSVSRVTSLRLGGRLLHLRTAKGETCVVEFENVFASVIDAAAGKATRRAGFAG